MKRLMTRASRASRAEIETAKAELRELLPKGSKLHMIVRSVSGSGMSRVITPVFLKMRPKTLRARDGVTAQYLRMQEGRLDLDHDVDIHTVNPGVRIGKVLGLRYVDDGNHSLRIDGTGMNMAFWLADALSHVLHGEPGAITHNVL